MDKNIMTELVQQDKEISRQQVNEIQEQLWQTNEKGIEPTVYAILGGAIDKQIEKIIRLGSLKNACLIDGKLSYEMAVVAPYMVRLEKDHPQTIEILQKGWGNSWGIFAITYPPATLINIRHNFKKIAMVTLPDEKRAYFRYYDPRVMRPYLPTCTIDEANQVFGHISEFVVEGEEAGTVHRFKRSEEGVVDVCISEELPAEQEDNHHLTLTPDDKKSIAAIKEQLNDDFIRQAIGYLKIKALSETDPNDASSLELLIDTAMLLSAGFKFTFDTPEQLANVAHTIDLWGAEYPNEDWAYTIYVRRPELSLDEKVTELYREKAFQMVGPDAIDYPTYCLLRFKERSPNTEYDNQDILIAAHLGLEAAKKYNLTDLNSAYSCTELMLVYGDDFSENEQCEQCQRIIGFFENDELSPFEKTYCALIWLVDSMESDGEGE